MSAVEYFVDIYVLIWIIHVRRVTNSRIIINSRMK